LPSGLSILIGLLLILGSGGLVLHEQQRRRMTRAVVLARMVDGLALHELASARSTKLDQLPIVRHLAARLITAGVQPEAWHAIVGVTSLLVSMAIGLHAYGVLGVPLAAIVGVSGFYLWSGWRAQYRRGLLLDQLPGFLDHLMRAVEAGSSMQQALRIAETEAPEPLRGVFVRVNRRIQLGAGLDDAMEHLEMIGLQELGMIALTVRVNQRFGGSIRELLRNVVMSVMQRDRSRREFRALTGETRLSAWVLALLPTAIALYISQVNPSYLENMLGDPAGKNLLMFAAGLQLVGSFILWRMVKSV